jgi:hypothetical protein
MPLNGEHSPPPPLPYSSCMEGFVLFLKYFNYIAFLFFLIFIVLGVHCGVYKSSYNMSNISYWNSPPPSFSFIPLPP